ncbi:alpha/beta fold hydrolase [Rhodococcus ruber]|uniref:alpha/beta fold hydrolase n=1 Tax=Rhodococcus TaxID=1827 RepID=UPI00029AD03B|nr:MULTISPECIES: alpha/beta hydrolase [Rhodococcus]ATQ29205.1 2-hydroxy-6-oxo-2,4-heptadienoate hydrolase [Rhodococcus ruber]AWH00643.1 2-hydroxy-6-oxo-2,4-heptadienoate hydrolase [Rhodococcus ruber]MCZ1074393.1 alpha/beta hydrolase [Rhodococcus sp. A5(2022)]QDC16043.1 alpha/beta fold hydrolase [Rhodococcus ruber]QRE82686.1 alpha/beta fold hydrolase [Rhodococcus ruber]
MTTTDLAQGRRVAVPGVTAEPIDTFYLEAGSGDPVVLLHGSGPGVSGWANWQHTIPGLAEHFRVIAPDTVGYGATSRPGDIVYSLRTWSDHILGLLDVLELDRVSLVGNSLGGRMALDLAERHPERISRMVLMGSPGVGMTVTDGLKALRAYEPSLENMRALLLDYFAVNPSIITDELVRIRYEASLETFDAYRAMFLDPRHKGNELGITEEQVRSIRTPSLLIHGREDKVVPPEVSWTMLHLLQDADLHVFARCGHWTQIERAAEFNELVADFLRG